MSLYRSYRLYRFNRSYRVYLAHQSGNGFGRCGVPPAADSATGELPWADRVSSKQRPSRRIRCSSGVSGRIHPDLRENPCHSPREIRVAVVDRTAGVVPGCAVRVIRKAIMSVQAVPVKTRPPVVNIRIPGDHILTAAGIMIQVRRTLACFITSWCPEGTDSRTGTSPGNRHHGIRCIRRETP